MKKTLLTLAIAALSFSATAEWQAKSMTFGSPDQENVTIYAGYTPADLVVKSTGAIAVSCYEQKQPLIVIEWPVQFNDNIDNATTKVMVDGRVFREKLNWGVNGNKFFLIAQNNPETVQVMKYGTSMVVEYENGEAENAVDMTATFDLDGFTKVYNEIDGLCKQ